MEGTFCVSRHRCAPYTSASIVFTPTKELDFNVTNMTDIKKLHKIFSDLKNEGFLSSVFEVEVNTNCSYKPGIVAGGFRIDVLNCAETFLPTTGDYSDEFRTYMENFASRIMRDMRFVGDAKITIYQNTLGSVVSSFIDPGEKIKF